MYFHVNSSPVALCLALQKATKKGILIILHCDVEDLISMIRPYFNDFLFHANRAHNIVFSSPKSQMQPDVKVSPFIQNRVHSIVFSSPKSDI